MKQKTQVTLFGADGVGKTSLLYKIKLNDNIKTLPTLGFNVEDIEYKDRLITIYDIGGQEKIRSLWEHYMDGNKCIIYILNLEDKERLNTYIECFNLILELNKKHGNIPIIIFGNKFNDKIEFEPEEMIQKSNLPPEIATYIIKGNITTGEGISELMDYIYNNIEFKEEKNEEKNEEKEEKNEDNEQKEKSEKDKGDKVTMFGLGDSGKTVILYLLKLGTKVNTIPTIGFNIETINLCDKNLTIWDIGGHEKIRCLWTHYIEDFEDINGLIWVYDISNKQTYEESQNELKKLLSNPKLSQDIPLLIFANKSDINVNGNQVEDYINGIQDILNGRPYFIKECNQDDLDSYKEGIDWLSNSLNHL